MNGNEIVERCTERQWRIARRVMRRQAAKVVGFQDGEVVLQREDGLRRLVNADGYVRSGGRV